jgi:hypothetical protein
MTVTTPHTEHLTQTQDHYRWRHDHLAALSILKRAEAAIFAFQARIVAHEAEISRQEEQISHGDAHAEAPPAGEHARFAKAHPHEHNDALLAAIRALEPHLKVGS